MQTAATTIELSKKEKTTRKGQKTHLDEEERIHLLQAKNKADAANAEKGRFLAEMSHEIRTPLNAVIGFTDLLMQTALSDQQVHYVQAIQQSGTTLLSLINGFLDFSKIESGNLDFETIAFDPELIAYDVCELIKPSLSGSPVELLCRIDDHLPATVKGDPLRFRQVITNLLGNASKFTERGEIELSLKLAEEAQDSVKLQVSIRDTGIGIPVEKQRAVFKPFQQAETSTARNYGGTGLGLAICKKISNNMGGDVWVESTSDRGCTFYFTAWLKKCETILARQPLGVSMEGKRVLVVDGNTTSAAILQQMLTTAGMKLTVAHRGSTVPSILRKAAGKKKPFDLCISDIQMPDTDGCQLASRIRSSGSPVSHIPLIALSSSLDRDARQCEKAGFNGFLGKPVHRGKLLLMIRRVLDHRNGQSGQFIAAEGNIHTQYSVREEQKHAVRILLVEDNPVNQNLVALMLKKAGYRVTVAGNGAEALKTFAATPENFDLIFMDIQMPEMDGRKTTRAIRQQGFEQIPIVAMTAHAMADEREHCLAAGMNDYITKPIKREAVFAVIDKVILKGDTA